MILDLSASGLRIESRDSVLVGQSYKFMFEHRGSPVEAVAEARWCKVDRTLEIGTGEFQPIFQAGFILKGAPPDISLPASYSPENPADES